MNLLPCQNLVRQYIKKLGFLEVKGPMYIIREQLKGLAHIGSPQLMEERKSHQHLDPSILFQVGVAVSLKHAKLGKLILVNAIMS